MTEPEPEVAPLNTDPQFAYFSIWQKENPVKVMVNANCGTSLIRDYAVKTLVHALDTRITIETRKMMELAAEKAAEARKKQLAALTAAENDDTNEEGETTPADPANPEADATEGEGEDDTGPDVVTLMNELRSRLIDDSILLVNDAGEEHNLDNKLSVGDTYSFALKVVTQGEPEEEGGELPEPTEEFIQLLTSSAE